MKAIFLNNADESIAEIKDIYEYLNIDIEKLHEQERINEIVRKLENKKREDSILDLLDGDTLNAKDINKVELIKHHLAKPETKVIH